MTVFAYTKDAGSIVNKEKGSNVMPTTTETRENVRGMRYCEIFVITHDLNQIRAAVYNTMGCNDCPHEQWQTLDPDALKKEFKANAITMNGPRYWIMDKLSIELPTGGRSGFI
jgi:hypothetical protein